MKRMKRRKLFGLLIFSGFILTTLLAILQHRNIDSRIPLKSLLPTPPISVLTPKIYQPIEHYLPPIIQKSPSYTLIFVGDSMTESLGENFDDLRLDLKKYYPEKTFGLFNYGFGSSNILSIEDRLNHDTVYQGKIFPAILSRDFDLILIESFGNNPLSQFSLDEGLQKQTAALDYMVAELTDTHPNSLIIFIATIAPSQTLYGIGAVDLSPTARNQWANERRAYIENHINYAESHNIPLIDIYEKTLDKNGLAITRYLDSSNYIHPSAEGVSLISQTIADYLYQNHILLN